MHANHTAVDRFRSKIDQSGPCWIWIGGGKIGGYGSFRLNPRPEGQVGAHYAAWILAGGRVLAPNEGIYHTCDIMRCVRNDDIGTYEVDGVFYERRGHLWIGTQADNMRDMQIKGRAAIGERNSSRLRPWRLPSGDRHPARIDPSYLARGERQGSAKLTADTVRTIRSEYANGARLTALGRRFNVSESAIRAVVERRTWRHIP